MENKINALIDGSGSYKFQYLMKLLKPLMKGNRELKNIPIHFSKSLINKKANDEALSPWLAIRSVEGPVSNRGTKTQGTQGR